MGKRNCGRLYREDKRMEATGSKCIRCAPAELSVGGECELRKIKSAHLWQEKVDLGGKWRHCFLDGGEGFS